MERSPCKTLTLGLLLCALCLSPASNARATGVLLLSGEYYDGNLQLTNNQIVATPVGGGSSSKVNLTDVFDAVFHEETDPLRRGTLPTGALLTNGSLVPGPVAELGDPLKVGNVSIPLSSVAWVIFQPITSDKYSKPTSGLTGAILPTGDFFPGTIGGVNDGRIAINSTLFGPHRFSIKDRREIAALVLREIQAGGARYQVLTRTGAVYLVNDIRNEGDNILLSDSILGNVKINKDELYEIRLPVDQYQNLTGLKPDRVDVPKGVDADTAVQTPKDAGSPDGQNLQTAANVAVTYSVPKGSVTFSTGVVVPQDAPAGAQFTFAVYGDGKFLLIRSPVLAVGNHSQHINVPVGNLHTITLRFEPASVGTGPASGQWIEPIFLRR
jgi:hypothetical protein